MNFQINTFKITNMSNATGILLVDCRVHDTFSPIVRVDVSVFRYLPVANLGVNF